MRRKEKAYVDRRCGSLSIFVLLQRANGYDEENSSLKRVLLTANGTAGKKLFRELYYIGSYESVTERGTSSSTDIYYYLSKTKKKMNKKL